MINMLEVNKSKLIKPMDIVIVPHNYNTKIGEYVYDAYIGGQIPVRVMSRSITKEQFAKLCGDV